MADRARRVEESRGGRSSHLCHVGVLPIRIDVSLFAWRRGENRKPNDPLSRPLFLQLLHVAALVMLLSVRTAVVMPLKNHKLSVKVREVIGLIVARCPGEVRRGLADLRGEN